MSSKLSCMRIFVFYILLLASLSSGGWTAEDVDVVKPAASSSTPRVEEIDDEAENSISSMPRITAPYSPEAVNFFDDQDTRMPFQLGVKFPEI
jgi:hypothetical protein